MAFFFFQAEDGIRDGHVTGVQTCALPISGYIADYHVRGILEDERAEIHAVVSRDITKAQKFAAQYEIPAAFDSLDGILDNDAIDAVVICTPNAFHAPYSI